MYGGVHPGCGLDDCEHFLAKGMVMAESKAKRRAREAIARAAWERENGLRRPALTYRGGPSAGELLGKGAPKLRRKWKGRWK